MSPVGGWRLVWVAWWRWPPRCAVAEDPAGVWLTSEKKMRVRCTQEFHPSLQVNLGKTICNLARKEQKRNWNECLYCHVDPQLSRKCASLHGANFYSKLRKQPFFLVWATFQSKMWIFLGRNILALLTSEKNLETTKYSWHWMFIFQVFFLRFCFLFLIGWGTSTDLSVVNLFSLTHSTGTSFNPIPTRGGTLCPPRYTSSNILGTPWATDLKLSDNLNELNWKIKIYFSTASAHPWLP